MTTHSGVYETKKATIKKVREMTSHEKLFEVVLAGKAQLDHQPGQFVEVLVPGYGEAPISVSSSPTKKDGFELCVRAAGNVTNALHRMKAKDNIGIRGPLGKGFDTKLLKGKDILFVGGGLGIAPMRSLIDYVLDNRKDYGNLTLLYGCKEPCESLFSEEMAKISKRDDIDYKATVDKCTPNDNWKDNVGVITTLIPDLNINVKKAYAVVVGPPIMYKFVIKALKEKKVPDNHIIVSLERRMKCGVGKCGHCQINNVYVCQDGPVFNYADIKDLSEAL